MNAYELTWRLIKRKYGSSTTLAVEVTSTQKPIGSMLRDATKYSDKFRAHLRAAGDFDRVDVYIDSRGGAAYSAMGMMHALRSLPSNIPIRVLIDGFCASAATLVAFGLDCPVYITPRSLLSFHAPRTVGTIQPGGELRQKITLWQVETLLISTYKARTKKPKSALKTLLGQGSTQLAPPEAVAWRFCDAVITRTEFEESTDR